MTDKDIEVIVKPIFTKMFKANFSACEYGIECYKKGMEYQGIKELAIENDNLIKRNTKLEKENAELKDDNKVMADNYSKMEQKFYDQLTKAKELLQFVSEYEDMTCYADELEEIKQFLKELEK